MKRFFIAVCLFSLLFLAACGSASRGENPAAVSGEPEETAAPAVEEPGPVEIAPGAADLDQQNSSGSFTGVAGTAFFVPEGLITPGSIPEDAYETDCNIAANNPDVTYFNKGENWFVQSGYNNNGDEIFYSKESSTDNGLKSFWITYPTAKREFGDPISAEFEKNCHF